MPRFSRDEILSAFESYNRARDEASRTGDWSIWARCFTEDAHYSEHAYGEMNGRAAIEKWITEVMAPFPTMTFPQDWWVVDEERGAVVFQCQNNFPEPFDEAGKPFGFPSWTRLVYAGGGLWQSEEDVYNPARDAGRVIKAWVARGGRFRSHERVKMAAR
jgi:hypothetical protein